MIDVEYGNIQNSLKSPIIGMEMSDVKLVWDGFDIGELPNIGLKPNFINPINFDGTKFGTIETKDLREEME